MLLGTVLKVLRILRMIFFKVKIKIFELEGQMY